MNQRSSCQSHTCKIDNCQSTTRRYDMGDNLDLDYGWRGKVTTSKSPIPDQDGVSGFSSAVNTYSGIHTYDASVMKL